MRVLLILLFRELRNNEGVIDIWLIRLALDSCWIYLTKPLLIHNSLKRVLSFKSYTFFLLLATMCVVVIVINKTQLRIVSTMTLVRTFIRSHDELFKLTNNITDFLFLWIYLSKMSFSSSKWLNAIYIALLNFKKVIHQQSVFWFCKMLTKKKLK